MHREYNVAYELTRLDKDGKRIPETAVRFAAATVDVDPAGGMQFTTSDRFAERIDRFYDRPALPD